MPLPPIFSIFGGFSFAFVAPCRRLAYIVYLVSHCFWRRLSCYAFMFPDFSNYSHCFNNLLNSFQYYILQLSTLHHYHSFTLYIPTIHNFFLYYTFPFSSPPFTLSYSFHPSCTLLQPSMLSYMFYWYNHARILLSI